MGANEVLVGFGCWVWELGDGEILRTLEAMLV